MPHREEQIIERVGALLEANANLQAMVYVHRVLSLSAYEGELDAVSVAFGADDPLADTMSDIDSLLTLRFVTIASGFDETEVRRKLSELRRQVHITVRADITLGLAFVSDIRPGQAMGPIFQQAEQLFGSRELHWGAVYRMGALDPG